MIRDNFTPTPNILFDKLLKELNNSELRILLVIIRQTNGWIDKKTTKRKIRDRITHSQFILKTGLSRRIISETIKSLSQKGLIEASDHSGNILNTPVERKGKWTIYYSPLLDSSQSLLLHKQIQVNNKINICKKRHKHAQNLIHNKRNYNKRNIIEATDNDYVHIGEVLRDTKFPNHK